MKDYRPQPIILGWLLEHGEYVCIECDAVGEESWMAVYQNDPEYGAWSPCRECGDEL